MPKLSIITINLNNATGLRKTIESVVCQTFKDYEYIIIDGGSTDGSVDVIQEHADKISYWVSEPDSGIYNAMNKGILKANGDYCLFLNSGDYLNHRDALLRILDSSDNEDLIYWDIVTDDGLYIKQEAILTVYKFIYSTIGHPASLIRRKLFFLVGLYNEKNRIVSDWEFFLKLLLHVKFSYKYINEPFTSCERNGISDRVEYRVTKQNERYLILNNEIHPLILKDYESWRAEKIKLKHYEKSFLIKMIINLQQSRIYILIMNFLGHLRLFFKRI